MADANGNKTRKDTVAAAADVLAAARTALHKEVKKHSANCPPTVVKAQEACDTALAALQKKFKERAARDAETAAALGL